MTISTSAGWAALAAFLVAEVAFASQVDTGATAKVRSSKATRIDEDWHAVGAAQAHAIRHQAVQVVVDPGR